MKFPDEIQSKYAEMEARRKRQLDDFGQRHVLMECRLMYERTNNPLYVTAAWRQCRMANRPIEEWIIEYLDRATQILDGFIQKPPATNPLAAIGKAFGFTVERKDRNPFTEFRIGREAPKWFAVYRGFRAKGLAAKPARVKTAELVASTESTVRRRLEWLAKVLYGPQARIEDLEKHFEQEQRDPTDTSRA